MQKLIDIYEKAGRDYKKEYDDYHSKPEQKKNRALRNNARRNSCCKKGDGKEVDHIKPLSKGGSNDKSNQRVVARSTNRKKGSD
jgi:5-methylcytosine-specific restriction endonuclease McrA